MAFKNRSPWIHQLDENRVPTVLHSDIVTDIAVVGAGIAGIATSFFLLSRTQKRVVLLDGGRLAHGATGHNAGQITSYFERSLSDICSEFGDEMTRDAQAGVESAWELLDHMYTTAGLTIPMSRFIGHAGIVDYDRVVRQLKDSQTREKLGLLVEELLIAKESAIAKSIPKEFSRYYKLVPHREILERLETHNTSFIACLSAQKGCVNSALFCQEIVAYLQKTYPKRFALYEHTHIHKVILKDEYAVLDAVSHEIRADRVALCTNGFEKISILNDSGLDIDTRFHHNVRGVIGFMSGYLKKYDKPPIAISYITGDDKALSGEYFYLTRRGFENENNIRHNLISIGGPEIQVEDTTLYHTELDYPQLAEQGIDEFVHSVFEKSTDKVQYEFKWHGLMGYTPNLIRIIGAEPKNPVLLYNLGCNGIGILPSVYGGNRISEIIAGKKLKPSIFDPRVE